MFIRNCQKCRKKKATEKHHLFSQTKNNRKLYGKLIDHPSNIQYLCYECHHNKTLDKYTEKEFCNIMNIELKSKSGEQKWRQNELS